MCVCQRFVYAFIRGAKGQEKLRITCILLNYLQHCFHTTKIHAGYFSEHIEEKISGLCSPERYFLDYMTL